MAILTSVFPPQQRGRVIGIAVTAVYIGLMSGPFSGGLLTDYLGWRSLFIAISCLGAIPLVLLLFFLKGEWADAAGESYDLVGLVLYVPSLIAIIYGISTLQQLSGRLIFAGGCCGLSAFFWWQRRVDDPLFQVNLFLENRPFALSNAAALIHYSATFGLVFLFSFYLQYIKGMDAKTTGLILIAQPLVMALCSSYAGRLSDRVEPRIPASIGMGITILMLFFFSFLDSETPVFLVVIALAVLGFGFALFSSPNMNAIMGSVEPRYLGIAAGSSGTMRVLGQVLSMGIATLVLSLYVGRNVITPDRYPLLQLSISRTFLLFSLLCLPGFFASMARGEIHGGGKK